MDLRREGVVLGIKNRIVVENWFVMRQVRYRRRSVSSLSQRFDKKV